MLVAGLLFFLSPAVAYLVGVRAEPIENRPLATLPSPSSGWGFFAGFDRWATDHLPLRAAAVRSSAAVSRGMFGEVAEYGNGRGTEPVPGFVPGDGAGDVPGDAAGDVAGDVPASSARQDAGSRACAGAASPETGTVLTHKAEAVRRGATSYPLVLAGEQDWLYFGDDVALACRPAMGLDDVFAGWRRLISAIERSGRRVAVTVAPDKSTVVPAHLPGRYAGQECSTARRAELWDRLSRGELGPAYVDLRGPLERQQDADGQPIYWPGDSHWAPRAEVVYAQELARRLAPELVADSDLRAAARETGAADLAVMLAQRRQETAPGWQVHRPGVTSPWFWQPEHTLVGRHRSSSTGPALIGGRVTLIGDSFSYLSLRQLVPYFSDLTLVSRRKASPDQKARAVLDADTVLLQVVERRFTSGDAALIDPAFLSRLERELADKP